MRLENKMHKWLKFFIKMIPFYFVVFSLFNVLFNETLQFDISSILSSSFGNDNFFVLGFNEFIGDTSLLRLLKFNRDTFRFITGSYFSNPNYLNAFELYNFVLCSFEWFILVDLFDLILSAFRFIIDICRSWLDSFYDKNKGGL